MTARPLDRLVACAREGATGELVCASASVEIHIYLQQGRIAWGTDSAHPFAFAAHLQSTTGIDPETFRQVVEECRRDRLPLGETLVEWGLTTWATVRASLAHQISLAIAQLAADTGQSIFLPRTYSAYDARLTFELREVIGEEPRPSPSQPAHGTVDPTRRGAARKLRETVDGLAWVESLDGEDLVDADPHTGPSRVPSSLVRATLLDSADFAAVRTARSSVVGFKLAQPCSIWCRVKAESTFGAVVSALAAIVQVEAKPRAATRLRTAAPWELAEGRPDRADAMRAFSSRATELAGAVILSAAGEPIVGVGAAGLDGALCVETARRRLPCLSAAIDDGDEDRSLDALGFSTRTMVSGEPEHWCFGAALDPASGETLWLFLERHSLQGLGWAYLAALTRTLQKVAP